MTGFGARISTGRVLAGGLLVLVLTACGTEPREIHYGEEECDHCRMVIGEARFSAQGISDRGRAYKFDAVECLAGFLLAGTVDVGRIEALWVADFTDPERWLSAEEAVFLRSDELRSPMGMGLTAHADSQRASALRDEHGGVLLDWSGVVELVGREWEGGRPPAGRHVH